MYQKLFSPLLTTAALALLLLSTRSAHAQPVPGPAGSSPLEQIVVIGTRVANRTVLDSAVPVDIITSAALQNVGVSEINQVLSVALPSFNFPRPGLADGTDTIRPATLRGLSPDQTLVLINGKRRHAAALVNVNGTIGRGAAAADLNTIPNVMLQSIEVLRDGASAQYGSDAIAGVINLRLRDNRDGGNVTVSYGARDSRYDILTTPAPANAGWATSPRLRRKVADGETRLVSAWKGLPLGSDGFVTVAAEYKQQDITERGGWDGRQQYPLVNGAFDPRELSIDRFNAWYGEPALDQKTLFLNAGYALDNGVELYGWAGWQDRAAKSAGFFRRALDDRNTIEIHPDGFLPLIAPETSDYSAALGSRGTLGDWDLDSSLVYGRNTMDFTIENSLNRSLGLDSKTVFDAGGFEYDQLVFNVSAVRSVESGLASPLNIAIGLEARREGYAISAGEPDSWRNGGALLPPPATAPNNRTQSGSQVFPGFRPENAVDEHRTALGAYLDLEANVTERLLASAALRAENYSDFGSAIAGKLALRYELSEQVALRASVQNGFRAPSLQQQFFATTSTNFIGGVPFDITTFPVSDPIARALGARTLDAEKSVNFSIGAVLRLGGLSVSVDAYHIAIDDRVVLSENLTQANVRDYLAARGFVGVGGGRFFINGVDTETSGVDIVLNQPLQTRTAGRFDLSLGANFNTTDVTRVPEAAPLAALEPQPVLFNRMNVLTFEEGSPESKLAASVNWSLARWGATLRATRYGEVLSPDTAATYASVASGSSAHDVNLSAKTLLDFEGRFALSDNINLALGAENLVDEYPDPNPAVVNSTGSTSFSNYAPFGRSGRYVYGRVSVIF